LGGADPAAAIRVAEAPPTYIATTQSPRSAVARADAWFTRAPLALVDDRFLLARDGAAVRALDLRASWLHVLGRRLSVKTPHTRPLLLPCKLAASDPVWRVCPRPALGELGFDIDDLGPAGYLVRGVPRVLPDLEWRRMFDELARGNERIFDPAAHVARAAAAVIELGRDGIPARAALDLLAQAAQAVALDLDAGAIAVTAALLGRAR
jgi:hypothetical protein